MAREERHGSQGNWCPCSRRPPPLVRSQELVLKPSIYMVASLQSDFRFPPATLDLLYCPVRSDAIVSVVQSAVLVPLAGRIWI